MPHCVLHPFRSARALTTAPSERANLIFTLQRRSKASGSQGPQSPAIRLRDPPRTVERQFQRENSAEHEAGTTRTDYAQGYLPIFVRRLQVAGKRSSAELTRRMARKDGMARCDCARELALPSTRSRLLSLLISAISPQLLLDHFSADRC